MSSSPPPAPTPGAPSPEAVLATTLDGPDAPSANAGPARDLVASLLAQAISLDEFLLGAGPAGLTKLEAARVATACAALPYPGAAVAEGRARSTGAPGRPRAGGTLRVGLWQTPEGMDPALATTRTSRLLTEQLYSTLTSLDADGRPYPDLAAWIEVSEDGRTYTFGLRRDVRFHDGQPVTATDVAFSLDRICDPAIHYHFEPWTVTMAGTEVVDTHTVRLHLRQQTAPILTWLAFCGSGIVPRDAVLGGRDLDRQPLGSGPFRLADDGLGSDGRDGPIRLVRHEGGTGLAAGGAWLDGLEFVTIADDSQRSAALLAGAIDLDALVGFDAWSRLQAAEHVVTSSVGDGRWHWLMVSCRDRLLEDARVRRAVSLALDREALIRDGLGGHGTPIVDGVIAGWSFARPEPSGMTPPGGDPRHARDLLDAAGVPAGTPISIATMAHLPLAIRQAELVAGQLAAAGFRPRVDVLDGDRWAATTVRSDGHYQLATSYWGSPINDPDDFVYMGYRSGARYETGGCGSDDLDELLEAGRRTLVQSERAAIYRAFQARAAELVPVIPTVQPPVLRAHTSRLRGFVPMRNAQLKTLRSAWLAD